MVDLDGAQMTSTMCMVLCFARCVDQAEYLDSPYMQSLLMAMEGSEDRATLRQPVRAILGPLFQLQKTGIVRDGVQRPFSFLLCNDEKMSSLILNRATGYCIKCRSRYMDVDDSRQPTGAFNDLSFADYLPHSVSWEAAAGKWLSSIKGNVVQTLEMFKSTNPLAQPAFDAWYKDHGVLLF